MSDERRCTGSSGAAANRRCRPVLAAVFTSCACLVAVGISGCKSVNTTPPLFASAELPVTLTEFRIRLNDFAEYFVAIIEDATEQAIDTSKDQLVRRNAMEFRLRAVNTFLNSLNQADPAAALIDAWAFCLQLYDFTETGAGAQLFGDHQAIVVEATRAVAEEVENVVAAVTAEPANEAINMVNTWADEHPLTTPLMMRGSSTVLLADRLEQQDHSAFAALGRLQAGVDDLVAQYQRYASIMPRASKH